MIKYFLGKSQLDGLDLRFERRSHGASGYDLMANLTTEHVMAPGERWFVSTALYLEMPLGIEAQIRTRSGLARDHGVVVLNAPGTIDSDYRGEVCVTLLNTDQHAPHTIHPGDRVAQLVFAPVFSAMGGVHISHQNMIRVGSRDDLSTTTRGTGGHGSTGR